MIASEDLKQRLYKFIYDEVMKRRPDFGHHSASEMAEMIVRNCKTEDGVRAFLITYMKGISNK